MTERMVTEPGRWLHGHNAELAQLLREWLDRDRPGSTGVVLIGVYPDAFALQYLGSQLLTAHDLEEYVLWAATKIAENYDPHGE